MHHLFSTELNTLNFAFTFAFTSSTYSRVVDFGHYFSPKSTLRLIRESTRTRVYTVNLYMCAHIHTYLHNNNNNDLRVSNIRVSNRTLIYNVCPKSALT